MSNGVPEFSKQRAGVEFNPSTMQRHVIVIDSRLRNIDQDGTTFTDGSIRSWSNFEVALQQKFTRVYSIELLDAMAVTANTTVEPFVIVRLQPNGKMPSHVGGTSSFEPVVPVINSGTLSAVNSGSQQSVYTDAIGIIKVLSTFGAAIVIDAGKLANRNSKIDFIQSQPSLNTIRVELYTVNATAPTSSVTYFQSPVYLAGPTMVDADNKYESTRGAIVILEIITGVVM